MVNSKLELKLKSFLDNMADEKKFNLDVPDGLTYYWHDICKEPRYFSQRNFGGGFVMIWAAFSAFGKSSLAFVDKRINLKGN